MEKTKQKRSKSNKVLVSIERIARWLENSKLTPAFFKKSAHAAKIIAGYFECTDMQAILFSIVCNLNFNRGAVDIDDMARFLDCAPVILLKYIDDIEALCDRKIIRRDYQESYKYIRGKKCTPLNNIQYYINKDVLDAIMSNEKFIPHKTTKTDLFGFLEAFKSFVEERDNGKLTYEELTHETKLLMNDNLHQEWIRELADLNLEEDDLCIYLYMCYSFIDDQQTVDISTMVNEIFKDLRTRMNIRKQFVNGDNQLMKLDMVEVEDGMFRSDRDLLLTEHGIDFFLQEDRKLFGTKKKKQKDLIICDNIPAKKLFFSRKEEESIQFLTQTLMPENYDRLTSRLKKADMKEGVAILFYGPPGTGKTESAYQVARKTGRDVKQVIISETKSMWFGESEKLIKKVFDSYRQMVEKSKIAPILLFNEADAIFSTRKQVGNSAVGQTENAIQNIILQEMEDLNGILIATTNLTDNLDRAFERRFLYKILLEKPDVEAKIQIWKEKIPKISIRNARILASRYDLSGGQIENVSRKCFTKQLLHGSMPGLKEILGFCEEESLEKQPFKKVGFKINNQK